MVFCTRVFNFRIFSEYVHVRQSEKPKVAGSIPMHRGQAKFWHPRCGHTQTTSQKPKNTYIAELYLLK